jgi:hypothetical protein
LKIVFLNLYFFYILDLTEEKLKEAILPSPRSSLVIPAEKKRVLTLKMKDYIWQFMLLHSEEGKSFQKFKGFLLRFIKINIRV